MLLHAFYLPTRYPNGHDEGAPFQHFGKLQSEEAIRYAGEIVECVRVQMARKDVVVAALEHWARSRSSDHPDLLRVGYFGSCSRSAAGVGSDLDVVLVLARTPLSPLRRPTAWDFAGSPVPVDVLVYTDDEWRNMPPRRMKMETVWVWER